MSSCYWRVTRAAVRRAMSLQDFNPASATYGCADRSFWQYRTIASFPAGTMQQVALPFAVLFETAFEGNQWHHDAEMLDRARAAMLFWARAQHPNGSVDEWYRHEHSYCATAFTTFGMAEACLRLWPVLPPADRDTMTRALRHSALWLADRFNDEVMNQNLAASAALWNVLRLTEDARARSAFERTWQRTRAHQDPEGWFVEYGGADLGYSLLALDLLASLERRGCTDAAGAAASLSRFIASFAIGGGDLAGRLGSRGTEHSFPFGAEAFAPTLPEAEAVAAHLRSAIDHEAVSDPTTVDDRYLAYFYLPSFVLACGVGDRALVPRVSAHSLTLERSGFRVWRGRGGDLVCSTRRNAAFNLYAPPRPVHHNLGYWIEAVDGRRFASCAWSADAGSVLDRADGVAIEGTFVRVDDSLPLVRHELAFRAATSWLFRYPSVAEPFHRFIRRRKITRKVAGPLAFTRGVQWDDGRVVVTDGIRCLAGAPTIATVTPAADIEAHSPSARQSAASRTHAIAVPRSTSEAWATKLNRGGWLVLVTSYETGSDGLLRFAGIREAAESA